MRGVVVAGAMMLGAVTVAQAADMPDLPILRGSFTDGLTTSRVNWEGYYLGGQGGYGSSDENFTGSSTNLLSTLLANNVVQEMGVAQWNLGFSKQSSRTSAFGAFTGYNWQWDEAVLGLEASYMHGNFGGSSIASKELVSGAPLSDTFYHDVAVTSTAVINITDMATFRGRAAYAFDCFLPYAFGGFALGNASVVGHTATVNDAVSATPLGPFTPLGTLSASDVVHNHLIYGYTAGLGVDINLVGGLFARAEYEYVRFTTSIDTSINTVRAGLGYKF